MGTGVGVFTNEEVKHLSDKQKLKLRADVIKALLKTLPNVKLRDQLAAKYRIKLKE